MPLWKFSESSQDLLKQCIEASTTNNNKWNQKFGNKFLYFNQNNEAADANNLILNHTNNEDIVIANNVIEIMDSDENTIDYELEGNKDLCSEILELDPVIHFDYITLECLKNPNIFPILADQLPIGAIEKLCEHVYNTDVNSIFMEHFYTVFLPTFVKREPTRFSLDLIVRARCYTELFKQLIAILLKDNTVPNNIIYEYVSTLNSNEHVEFLNILSQLDVTNDVFIHHLSAIHIAYKNLGSQSQNDKLLIYIKTKLIDISQYCKTSKQYGRFLLTFLQSLRSCPTNVTEIQNVIDNHGSPFKKPCLNILSAMKEIGTSQSEETFN